VESAYKVCECAHRAAVSVYEACECVSGEMDTGDSLSSVSASVSCQPTDSHHNNNYSSADGDETGAACDDASAAASDVERRQAMLAAMQVSSDSQLDTAVSDKPSSMWSVEACLSRFTQKETLSGANMIICQTCSHTITPAGDANTRSSSEDQSSSSPFSSSGMHCLT